MKMLEHPPPTARDSVTIGITGHDLEGQRGGPGRWVFELCRGLGELMPRTRFIIYSRRPIEMPIANEQWTNRIDPLWQVHRMKDPLWLVSRVGTLCRSDHLDILWSTSPFSPRLESSIRKIVTVHDLKHRVLPRQISASGRIVYRLLFERSLKAVDAIIALSHGTAGRLLRLYGLKASAVVPAAVSEHFRPAEEAAVREVLERRGIRRPYILTVASGDKNKNLGALFTAFLKLAGQADLARHTLIVAGKRSPQVSVRVRAGERLGIVSVGFVPDNELPALYTGSDLFVLPSLYEGFGIPVLEARSCGTRVLTTDIPELREAGGDDAIYCAPSAEAIQRAILQALRLPRPQSADGGGYSWHESARTLANLFADQAAKLRPQTSEQMRSRS